MIKNYNVRHITAIRFYYLELKRINILILGKIIGFEALKFGF
jgi:hypothetical protein